MEFLQGKKTYIVVGLFVIAGLVFALNAAGVIDLDIPETVWAVIAALGFGAVRSALRAIQPNHGWKTYAAVLATVFISAVDMLGLNIPLEVISLIYTVTGSLGVIGIRDAVNKLKE